MLYSWSSRLPLIMCGRRRRTDRRSRPRPHVCIRGISLPALLPCWSSRRHRAIPRWHGMKYVQRFHDIGHGIVPVTHGFSFDKVHLRYTQVVHGYGFFLQVVKFFPYKGFVFPLGQDDTIHTGGIAFTCRIVHDGVIF